MLTRRLLLGTGSCILGGLALRVPAAAEALSSPDTGVRATGPAVTSSPNSWYTRVGPFDTYYVDGTSNILCALATPLAGVKLSLVSSTGIRHGTEHTDAHGHARFTGVPKGFLLESGQNLSSPVEYTIRVLARDYAPSEVRVVVDGRECNVRIPLHRGRDLEVTPRDRSGQPLRRQRVRCSYNLPGSRTKWIHEVQTNRSGRATFRSVAHDTRVAFSAQQGHGHDGGPWARIGGSCIVDRTAPARQRRHLPVRAE